LCQVDRRTRLLPIQVGTPRQLGAVIGDICNRSESDRAIGAPDAKIRRPQAKSQGAFEHGSELAVSALRKTAVPATAMERLDHMNILDLSTITALCTQINGAEGSTRSSRRRRGVRCTILRRE
jgi:hypothetical protein